MTDAPGRAEIVRRLRTVVAEQRQLFASVLPEAERWAACGLGLKIGFSLAFADRLETWRRIKALGVELDSWLRMLEKIDPEMPRTTNPVVKLRHALGLPSLVRVLDEPGPSDVG